MSPLHGPAKHAQGRPCDFNPCAKIPRLGFFLTELKALQRVMLKLSPPFPLQSFAWKGWRQPQQESAPFSPLVSFATSTNATLRNLSLSREGIPQFPQRINP